MIWNKPKLLATVARCSAGMVENPPTIHVYAVKFTMIKRKKYIKVFLEKERQFDLSDATVHQVYHALPDGAALKYSTVNEGSEEGRRAEQDEAWIREEDPYASYLYVRSVYRSC